MLLYKCELDAARGRILPPLPPPGLEVKDMEITDIIAQLGFPIAVAIFALWNSYRHEIYLQDTLTKTIKENTAALEQLKDLIKKIAKKEDEDAEV